MRAYFFSNMYISGIHTGIQAGHAITEMFIYYTDVAPNGNEKCKAAFEMLKTFARDHKTFVILNGGDHQSLQDMLTLLNQEENPGYPRCFFTEPGLNNAMTSVCVVLPERMYDETARAVGKAMLKTCSLDWSSIPQNLWKEVMSRQYTPWERTFLMFKERCGLAN